MRLGMTRNVAIPAGDIYPNGVTPTVAPGDVQATTRPVGWLFRHSAGFATVRPGKTEFQDAQHGPGIHFTPQRFAEDIGASVDGHGLPLMVDKASAVHMADLAELPGSDRLDDDGTVTPWEAAGNRGVLLSDSSSAPVGGKDVRESERTLPDLGDRDPTRPITRAAYGLFHNPVNAFRSDLRSPTMSVLSASAVIGFIYLILSNAEREYKSRKSRGTGAVGAAAATPVAAAGAATNDVAEAVGKVAESAGKAVEEVTDAAADVVKED